MKNINYDFVLEQIYNFLLLRPEFNSKTNFEKIAEYFRALNEGTDDEFNFEKPNKISGKFGNKKNIVIVNAPEINNKNKFLEWVDRQINL
ncbi:hypothetical protein M2R48_08620 [Acinetobacter sp. I-MWF]|uniref:hypothetical protein n=1 Tax=Acinetobacter sp. I-MWF TaxID=2940517 RepID=UPI0021C61439|nr:hypothetical protein [Acinetobacter sp. I-MWF]MCT9978385.1 hypothetical protein [Acinetobacter sp. I-MWF]